MEWPSNSTPCLCRSIRGGMHLQYLRLFGWKTVQLFLGSLVIYYHYIVSMSIWRKTFQSIKTSCFVIHINVDKFVGLHVWVTECMDHREDTGTVLWYARPLWCYADDQKAKSFSINSKYSYMLLCRIKWNSLLKANDVCETV